MLIAAVKIIASLFVDFTKPIILNHSYIKIKCAYNKGDLDHLQYKQGEMLVEYSPI